MQVAQELLQTKGFHAFSYADIAKQVGIRKASIHYYFPSKTELGEALIKEYRLSFTQARAAISESTSTALGKLQAYAELYRHALVQNNRMCLCGMMAADFMTLPESIQTEVRAFMSENVLWLAEILEDAKRQRELTFEGSAEKEASFLLSSLEGSMLVARSMAGLVQFDDTIEQMFARYK